MRNEYGALMDSNKYCPSIIPKHNDHRCFLCGSGTPCERHEIFHSHMGAYRDKSKRYGLWVHLCEACHDEVHRSAFFDRQLKIKAQEAAHRQYGWDAERFIQEFGRNYIEED